EDEQVDVASADSGEGNGLAVRRPCRVEDLSGFGYFDLACDAAVLDVQDREHRAAAANRTEDELPAVGAPRSGRADELETRVVLAERRVDELPHDAARRRFGEVE